MIRSAVYAALGHLRNAGRYQHARLHLVMVAVPQPPLLLWQRAEPRLTDYVFDADQSGIVSVRVEDHALVEVVTEMNAKVGGFNLASSNTLFFFFFVYFVRLRIAKPKVAGHREPLRT